MKTISAYQVWNNRWALHDKSFAKVPDQESNTQSIKALYNKNEQQNPDCILIWCVCFCL